MAAVLVHIDLDGDRPDASSLVALAAGRRVASSWGATLYAAVIAPTGAGPARDRFAALERALAAEGADKVLVATMPPPIAPLWASVGHAWQRVVDHVRPRVVLFGADAPAAPELAPRTAARIGARLLPRARTFGGDDIELHDRDGLQARAADSGAAVALVARTEKRGAASDSRDTDIDVIVLEIDEPGDARLELTATVPADAASSASAIVALGDDVRDDAALVAAAEALAGTLDATVVRKPDAGQPLAPALCVVIGEANLDVAGASNILAIDPALMKRDLASRLEDA